MREGTAVVSWKMLPGMKEQSKKLLFLFIGINTDILTRIHDGPWTFTGYVKLF